MHADGIVAVVLEGRVDFDVAFGVVLCSWLRDVVLMSKAS